MRFGTAPQLAIDATLVSPVSRDGRPHPGADTRPDIEQAAMITKDIQVTAAAAVSQSASLKPCGSPSRRKREHLHWEELLPSQTVLKRALPGSPRQRESNTTIFPNPWARFSNYPDLAIGNRRGIWEDLAKAGVASAAAPGFCRLRSWKFTLLKNLRDPGVEARLKRLSSPLSQEPAPPRPCALRKLEYEPQARMETAACGKLCRLVSKKP